GGGGEIGGAERLITGHVAEKILDTGTIRTGRGAKNARRDRLASGRGPARGSEGILFIGLLAPRYRTHSRIQERDLARKQVAEQPRDTKAHVDSRPANCGDRQHLDPGDAAGSKIPRRPAAHECESVGDLLATGA